MPRRGEELPVKVQCVAKRGQCQYEVGDQFTWTWACEHEVECPALKAVLRIYAPLCSLGCPSWELDANVWMISCPSKGGIVVRMQAVE